MPIKNEQINVTVILTVWKRDNLEEQLNALARQTHLPNHIWVYHCGSYVNIDKIKFEYPDVQYIESSVNLGYFGRFSIAKHASPGYLWVLDDDVIPGPNWISICLGKSQIFNAVLASTGRILPVNDYRPEQIKNVKDYFYGDVKADCAFNHCNCDTFVDFGCNSWFFKTEWIKIFWELYPFSFATGEDIHLSASLNISLGIKTLVPEQLDFESSGNQKKMYGYDQYSSWNKPDFLDYREGILRYLVLKKGWKPILWKF